MANDSTVAGTSDIDFKTIIKRFSALNNARLQRTLATLSDHQQTFIELLPLLFHINHPLLPGYASRYTPAGVCDFEPSKRVVNTARGLAHSLAYRKVPHRKRPILAVYMMGSPGTVAYSQGSDIDIWVCHDPSLDGHHRRLLQQKAEGIELWAASRGLEAHIFLIDPDRFRGGEISELSKESSGSTQHTLLLEEFYRTAILLAGQRPIWWLVPPAFEDDYDNYVATLKRQRFIHAKNTLDLGGLAAVPAEEFYGAALWQLFKGIDSPYKAILKLLLIEAYTSAYPTIDLLAYRFKQGVYDGEGEEELNTIDPYILMLDRVSDYLTARGEQQRLELARRCFYFKADEHLSVERADHSGWRRELLTREVANWGWHRPDLIRMDGRNGWKVQQVTEERRVLYEALIASYRFLSEFARAHATQMRIEPQDLTILGRKLYTTFERKSGKVELINQGITASLHEPRISLHEMAGADHQDSWQLFTGVVPRGNPDNEVPMKRSRSIVELVSWCYFNGIIDKGSLVGVYHHTSTIGDRDIQLMVRYLLNHFPLQALQQGTIETYREAARPMQHCLFINLTANPIDQLNQSPLDIASSNVDALSYGPERDNLVLSVEQLIVTSWREVLTHHYVGIRSLLDSLCDYLKWYPLGEGVVPRPVEAYTTASHRGPLITRRVTQLCNDIIDLFYGGQYPTESRYLLAVGRGYAVLQFKAGIPSYQLHDDYPALQRYLAAPQPSYSPLLFDPLALHDTPLPTLFERNREGLVQLFYLPAGDNVDIYVLDERGSLFHCRAPFFDEDALLSQYSHFFEQVLNRVSFMMQEGEMVAAATGMEFYRIDKRQGFQLTRRSPHLGSGSRPFFSLQVLIDSDTEKQTLFSVYCEGQEFTTLEYGDQLNQTVVDFILHLRKSGNSYPLYITDIGFSHALLGDKGIGRVQTLHFLNYKKRIEERLNQSMAERD